jgi:hypothetical protein
MLPFSPTRYCVVACRCCYHWCNVIAVCFLLSPAGSALETALLLLFQSFYGVIFHSSVVCMDVNSGQHVLHYNFKTSVCIFDYYFYAP